MNFRINASRFCRHSCSDRWFRITHPATSLRRRRVVRRRWSTEPLETRQLLTGDFVWASALQTTGQNYGDTLAVTSDGSGSIYATGVLFGTLDFDPGAGTAIQSSASSYSDIYITKTSADGNLQWVKTIGGTGSDSVTDIALDSQGNICLSGTFEGQVDMDPGAGIQLKIWFRARGVCCGVE